MKKKRNRYEIDFCFF